MADLVPFRLPSPVQLLSSATCRLLATSFLDSWCFRMSSIGAPFSANSTCNEPSGSPEALCIFVSYRTTGDARLATALKKLIENAIEPQPSVFVSGDGGLRPSNLGLKQQLQSAAQRAHAFVAIITNSSKDREWIFFEAGAAWGRDLLYAPVLI